MRCVACDVRLTDFESTRKYEGTYEFIDLCNHCLDTLEVHTAERYDLEGKDEHFVEMSELEDVISDEDSV